MHHCTFGLFFLHKSHSAQHTNHTSHTVYNIWREKKENAIQLHGGAQGWDKAVWKIYDLFHGTVPHVVLEYDCLEKDSGHPGDVYVLLKYSLRENTLQLEYKAKTTRATPINLTNHSYFNLSGAPNLGDHELMIQADEVLELDHNMLPTGVINTVKKTDFDSEKVEDEWMDLSSIIDQAIDEVNTVSEIYSKFDNKPIKVLLNNYELDELTPLLNKLDQDIIDSLTDGYEINLQIKLGQTESE